MESHGYLSFKWSNNVLYVNAFGPFNDEGAKEAAEAYIKEVVNKKSLSFSVVELLDSESIGSPNTMNEVSKLWCFLGEHGCTSLGIIYSNDIQRSLAEKYLPIFGKLFSKVEDAEKWFISRDTL